MTPTRISFDGASDFDITGGNFGKVNGDIKTITVSDSQSLSSIPESLSRGRTPRRRRNSASSVSTPSLPRHSSVSSVSTLDTLAEESEAGDESDYTSPPSSVDLHQPRLDSPASSPHQPVPPHPREPRTSTPARGRTTEVHRSRRTGISQHSGHSSGGLSQTAQVLPSPFPRPANPEPFQAPGAPPPSTRSSRSNLTPSTSSNQSTPRNTSRSLRSIPPAAPTDALSTPRSHVLDVSSDPARTGIRHLEIHSRPLPSLPTESYSPTPTPQSFDHTPSRVVATNTDASPVIYSSPMPPSNLTSPGMLRSGGGSSHPIIDHRPASVLSVDPFYYSPSPATPAMVYSPHASAGSGYYRYSQSSLREGSPYAVVPNNVVSPAMVPPNNLPMYHYHRGQAQVPGMQPQYPQMPYSSPPFSGYGVPVQNYMPWMGGRAAYGGYH